MLTNGEIIQRIQSEYSKGVQSDDTRLSNRLIYDKIVTVRNNLIANKLNKNQKISNSTYQVINAIETELAPPHEVANFPPILKTILRTKYRLPTILTNKDAELVNYVGLLDGSIFFNLVSWKTVIHQKKGNRFTGNKPKCFLKNDYLYITEYTSPVVLSLEAIFDNPLQADTYRQYGQQCDDCIDFNDYKFPFDTNEIDALTTIVSEQLIKKFKDSREDQINNGEDDTK